MLVSNIRNDMDHFPDKILAVKNCESYACIDVMRIEKISLLPEIFHSPTRLSGIVGVLNYKRNNIPVFDLATLTKMKRDTPYTSNNIIIIIHATNSDIAIIVDEIIDLYKSNESDSINPIKQDKNDICVAYMSVRGLIYNLIDVDKVVTS